MKILPNTEMTSWLSDKYASSAKYVTVECGCKPSQKSGIMKWAGVGAHAELEITPYHEIHDI